MQSPERVFRVTPGTAFASGVTISGTAITIRADGKLRISIAVDESPILNIKENAEDLPLNGNIPLIGSKAVELFETMVTKEDPFSLNFTGVASTTIRKLVGHFFASE